MIEILKDIDQDLFESYNSSILMWENRNKGIYIFLQQYLELLIKHIIKEENKTSYLGPKPNLGSMLDNRFVIDLLKYDLNLNEREFNVISEINKAGNSIKHTSNSIYFLEDIVKVYLVFNYNFTQKYLKFKKNIILKDLSKEAYIRLDEHTFKQEVNEAKHTQLNHLYENNRIIINAIEQKNFVLNNQNENIKTTFKNDEKLDSFSDLKSKFGYYTNEIENLNLQLDKTPDSIELQTKIEEHTYYLDEIETLLKGHKNRALADKDVSLQKNSAVIESNKIKLSYLEKEKQKIISIKDSTISDIYDDISSILASLKVSFNSCYLGDKKFTLCNFKDEDLSVSKYRSYYATMFNQLIKGLSIPLSDYLTSINLSECETQKVYQVEICILSLIRNGRLGDNEWRINFSNTSLAFVNIAIGDIQYRIKQLTILSDLEYSEPKVILTNDNYMEDGINILFDVVFPSKTNCYTIIQEYNDRHLSNIWIAEKIKYTIKNEIKYIQVLEKLLFEFFGFDCFRPGQIDILINTLNGNNTIGILTTSGGKSLIYQFASLMQPKITIVVDPIVALINDQARKIVKEFKIDRVSKVIYENSISPRKIVEQIYERPSLLIFSTPERFQDSFFRDWLIAQSIENKIGLIVLDEVHCLSEWGHDFRISYLMLSHTINTYCSNFQYLGLTATAAINVIKDLQIELGIYEKENIIFSRKLQRENLTFKINKLSSYEDMNERFDLILNRNYLNDEFSFKLPNEYPNALIVFFKDKDTLKDKFDKYIKTYPEEITFYHGGDKNNQDPFMSNSKTLLFSTKAFGMGIDKPNVRGTIHFGMPASRESFFQEAGRAGRDGNKSQCVLLTFNPNKLTQIYFKKFLDLSTDVKELLETKNKLGFRTTNDLSTIAHLMLTDISTPEQEATESLNLFKILVSKAVDYKCSYETSKENLNSTQVLLYILHKVGIIRTWTIKYIVQKCSLNIQFFPDFEDIDYIKQSAINYLNQYAPNSKLIENIESINDNNDLNKIIIIVRDWYQSTFLRSKREQLANMVDFIERYQNQNKNTEIQDEMSQFFDITRLLERRDSKTSLTFEGVKLKSVLQRANKIKKIDLNEMRITMERLLETEESTNINIFMSIIMFRLDNFASRNGRDRLLLALNKLEKDELMGFYKNIKGVYTSAHESGKKQLLEFLFKYDELFFMNYLFDDDYIDEFTSPYIISSINSRYKEIF